jgi:hypothetical protein
MNRNNANLRTMREAMEFISTYDEISLVKSLRRFFFKLHGTLVFITVMMLGLIIAMAFTLPPVSSAPPMGILGGGILIAVNILLMYLLFKEYKRITNISAINNAGLKAKFFISPEKIVCGVGSESHKLSLDGVSIFAYDKFWFFYPQADLGFKRIPLPLDISNVGEEFRDKIKNLVVSSGGKLLR